MADEVNQFAHDGGDTAPGTREQIKARNEAHDALSEAVSGASGGVADAIAARDQAIKEAEVAYAEAVPDPSVVGPAEQAAPTATASKSKSSE